MEILGNILITRFVSNRRSSRVQSIIRNKIKQFAIIYFGCECKCDTGFISQNAHWLEAEQLRVAV